MTDQFNLPDIPDRIRLRLRPGEWSHWLEEWPGEPLELLAVAVVPHQQADRVWLAGHGIECDWTSSICEHPCMNLVVMRAALLRALAEAVR